ncbi:MAG: endonuclease/exonuclease/phosphatase family protein [Sphingobacteriaceae bacterium]
MIRKKARKNLNFWDRLVLLLNMVASLALLISYLASIVDPRKIWQLAFFGLAYPGLLLVNLIILFYWVLRKKNWVLLPLSCILIGWNVLLNNVSFRSGTKDGPKQSADQIRVMTYNVHNFKRFGAKNDKSTKDDILNIIKMEQPDIICFQEFYTRRQGEFAIRDSLRKILNSNYYYFQPVSLNKYEAIGMAIFSKLPIVKQGLVPFKDSHSNNQCLYTDLQKGKRLFRVYNVHLQSINFKPEDYSYLDSVSNKGKADIPGSRRIGSKLKQAFLKRSEQVILVKTHAQESAYPYLIAGDFNDTPASFAVNKMATGIQNTFREKGSGFSKTYNGMFPNYQIDYIMASAAFQVLNYKVLEKKLSDHYPVRSDLLLK